MKRISSTTREKVIVQSGAVAITTNFLLAVFKIVVGLISNSIAVMSDALHGLIDSISGIVLVVTGKLATSKKFIRRRAEVERTATIIIAIIIILVGIHIIIESIEKLVSPEEVEYSVPTMIVLVASVIVKLLLGLYLKKRGRAINSDSLIASGVESLNDVIISVAVLISAIIYLIWKVDIEAYVSLLIAAIIIKLGLEFLFPNVFRHHHISTPE